MPVRRLLVIRTNVLGNTVLGSFVQGALHALPDIHPFYLDLNASDIFARPASRLLSKSVFARTSLALSKLFESHNLHPQDFAGVLTVTFTTLLALPNQFRRLPRACLFDGAPFANVDVIPSRRRRPSIRDKVLAGFYQTRLTGSVSLLPMSDWARASFEKHFGRRLASQTRICPAYSRLDAGSAPADIASAKRTRNTDLRLLFVGNYLKEKGGLDLINLFVQRLHRCSSLTVVTAQRVPIKHDKLTVRNDIRVENKKELEQIYRSHDVFVFPSVFDFFGLVVVEAMSQGMAVLAYDIAAMGEMIKEGENGYLIPHGPRSLEILADRVESLALNPARAFEMGQNSLRLAMTHFSRQRFDNAIRDSLETILGHS